MLLRSSASRGVCLAADMPPATFTQVPVAMGRVTTAVFDDTCGNLIQIASSN